MANLQFFELHCTFSCLLVSLTGLWSFVATFSHLGFMFLEMKFYKISSGGACQILSLINTGGTLSR